VSALLQNASPATPPPHVDAEAEAAPAPISAAWAQPALTRARTGARPTPWWARRRTGLAALAAALLAALAGWSTRSASVPTVSGLPNEPRLAAAPQSPAARDAAAASVLGALQERLLPGAGLANASSEALMKRAGGAPGSPEGRLLRVYALMAEAQGDAALDEARRLTQDVPNFALAHLVYADLLKGRTAPLPQFGAAASAVPAVAREVAGEPTPAERLKELSAEARVRVGSATAVPPAGALPAQFVYVSPLVKHAIAVDASRSRLYLFENTANGMVLKRDFYASVGKLGTAKRVEGDLRTPLGVYFVTGRLSKKKLADRYGASAMVLNYPNQYDQLRGRTGSGIWLHGVESSYFSRAPLATDGCVALSNIDLLALTQDVDRQATPVVIAERLEWVAPANAVKPPDRFTQALDAWRAARQAEDPSTELGFYAADTRYAAAPSGTHWADAVRAERSRPGSSARLLTPLSVLAWHDQEDVILVTYSETTARDSHPRLKRQYWLLRDDRWRIVFDGAVG